MGKLDTFKTLAKSQGYSDAEIETFASLIPPESTEFPGYTVPQIQQYQSEQKLKSLGGSPMSLDYPGLSVQDVAKTKSEAKLKSELATDEKSAAQLKKEETSKSILGLTDTLKSLYNLPSKMGMKPEQSKPSLALGKKGEFSFIPEFKKNIDIMRNLDPQASTYKRLREGFVASIKELTGDVGVLTEPDAKRLMNALPKFGDDPETAALNWQKFDEILQSKLGSAGKYSYLPETPQPLGVPKSQPGRYKILGVE